MSSEKIYNQFVYDPKVAGYDSTFWKTIAGIPSISSNLLRLSAAEINSRQYYRFGNFTFSLTIPSTPTAGVLTGGTSATSVIGTWNAVTDGEFTISIDGVAYDITGLDFSTDSDMDDVASRIQSAIRTATGEEETCVWDTDHFVITSSSDTSVSTVSVTSAVSGGSGTDISGVGATPFIDGETGQGTATAGTAKSFGLKIANGGNKGKVDFEIVGAKLHMVVYNNDGTEKKRQAIAWEAGWTTVETDYEIRWTAMGIRFFVAGACRLQYATKFEIREDIMPDLPTVVFIDNDDTDNTDLTKLVFKFIQSLQA